MQKQLLCKCNVLHVCQRKLDKCLFALLLSILRCDCSHFDNSELSVFVIHSAANTKLPTAEFCSCHKLASECSATWEQACEHLASQSSQATCSVCSVMILIGVCHAQILCLLLYYCVHALLLSVIKYTFVAVLIVTAYMHV